MSNTQDLIEEILNELLNDLGIQKSNLTKYDYKQHFIKKLKNSTIIYDISNQSMQMYDIVKSDIICNFEFDTNKLFLYYLLEQLNLNLRHVMHENDKEINITLIFNLGPSLQYSSSYLSGYKTIKQRKFTIELDINDFSLVVESDGISNNDHVNISNDRFCIGNSVNIIKQYHKMTNKYNFSFLSDLYYYQNEHSGYRSAINKNIKVEKLGTVLNDWVRYMKKTKFNMEE